MIHIPQIYKKREIGVLPQKYEQIEFGIEK